MRIFDFVVVRLKFLTWASKPRWASPPIVLLCSDWLPFELGKFWESRYSGYGDGKRPHLCHRVQRAGHVRRRRHGSGNCSSGAGYWLTELRASWWKWVRIGPIICSGWAGYWTTTLCCLAANHPRVLYWAAETKPVSSGGTVPNHSKLGWTGKWSMLRSAGCGVTVPNSCLNFWAAGGTTVLGKTVLWNKRGGTGLSSQLSWACL